VAEGHLQERSVVDVMMIDLLLSAIIPSSNIQYNYGAREFVMKRVVSKDTISKPII
jgi:hypothetical protein